MIEFCFQSCQLIYTSAKRKCKCGGVVHKISERTHSPPTTKPTEKYISLGETKGMNNCIVKTGEPILLNPNSYENVK